MWGFFLEHTQAYTHVYIYIYIYDENYRSIRRSLYKYGDIFWRTQFFFSIDVHSELLVTGLEGNLF